MGSRTPEQDPDHLFVPEEEFIAQVRTLLRRGWHPVDLTEHRDEPKKDRQFLLTFDDGYASMRDVAAPTLASMGVPSVCFVLPGVLGGTSTWNTCCPDEPLVGAADLSALESSGMRVELHGWDHASLVGLTPGLLHQQVAAAADQFATVLGRRPTAFAYPYGHHDAAAREAVAEAGIKHAFAVHDGLRPGHPHRAWAVPRVDINSTDTARSLRLKTSAAYPVARLAVGRVPAIRRAVHRVVGLRRGDPDDLPGE